jgi:hypothetical protein
VSPLSHSESAAIVNPGLNGWIAQNGTEIDDNGCVPLGSGDDGVTIAGTAYDLQREFNNGGVISTDPNAPTCAPSVQLAPEFVVPSAVDPGDVVEFDGSKTVSTLLVPKANYSWNFGDGTTATGPSIEHTYSKAGNYIVDLTVTDRGGNVATLSQPVSVLGSNGKPVAPINTSRSAFRAHLTLMPQSLQSALRNGVGIRIKSNQAADGIATLSISRKTANRAGIRHARGEMVVIGRGTVSGITVGSVKLHLRLPKAIATKLARLHHVTLSVRLALVAANGVHEAIDAAGRY